MRTDLATGLPAYTKAEAEKLNPPGPHPAQVADLTRWPALEGYVVKTSFRPFAKDWSSEPELREQAIVQTQHGLVAIWKGDDALAGLFSAEPGTPFRIKSLGQGRFEFLLGQPHIEGEADRALLEAAEALLRGERPAEGDLLFRPGPYEADRTQRQDLFGRSVQSLIQHERKANE